MEARDELSFGKTNVKRRGQEVRRQESRGADAGYKECFPAPALSWGSVFTPFILTTSSEW